MNGFSLATQNPWWLDSGRIRDDEQVKRVDESPVKWEPTILNDINLNEDRVYTLRGPRQVGKTTAMKLIIRRLLASGLEPRRVFYWTCDLVPNPTELARLLAMYIEQMRRITGDRLYIFLDEVSAIRDWQKAVKYLYDTGNLKGCTLLVTGSHSLDLRRASERLPGRRGVATDPLDRTLLPMRFREYVEVLEPELGKLIGDGKHFANNHSEALDSLTSGVIPPGVEELSLHSTRLGLLLDSYLITGGIISSINEYVTKGRIDQGLYQTYLSAVIGDVSRWGKREIYLAALLRRIEETTTTKVSWNTLKKDTDIGHTDTVSDYIDALESSYVVQVLYKLDTNTGDPKPEKEKKIYFRDPFIYHTLTSWVHQEAPYESTLKAVSGEAKAKIVESVICDHLTRLAYSLRPMDSYESRSNLFYWTDKTREIDFVVKTRETYLPFEVKYQNTISSSDYTGLRAFPHTKGGNGVLVTRGTLERNRDMVAIPAHILLILI